MRMVPTTEDGLVPEYYIISTCIGLDGEKCTKTFARNHNKVRCKVHGAEYRAKYTVLYGRVKCARTDAEREVATRAFEQFKERNKPPL